MSTTLEAFLAKSQKPSIQDISEIEKIFHRIYSITLKELIHAVPKEYYEPIGVSNVARTYTMIPKYMYRMPLHVYIRFLYGYISDYSDLCIDPSNEESKSRLRQQAYALSGILMRHLSHAETQCFAVRRFLSISVSSYLEFLRSKLSEETAANIDFPLLEIDLAAYEKDVSAALDPDTTLRFILKQLDNETRKAYVPGFYDSSDYIRETEKAYILIFHLLVELPVSALRKTDSQPLSTLSKKYSLWRSRENKKPKCR